MSATLFEKRTRRHESKQVPRRAPASVVLGSTSPRLRPSCVATGRPPQRSSASGAREHQPRADGARPALHLTRRGRLVLLILLLAFLSVAFSVGRVTSTAIGSSAVSPEVVVHQGDTLWGIAERVAPNSDPREVAAQLMEVNGLSTPSLQAGQRLRLP